MSRHEIEAGRIKILRTGASRAAAKLRAAVALLGSVPLACAKIPSAYDQYLIPEAEFRVKVNKVVVAPVVLQTDIAVPESILVQLDSLIQRKLTAAGLGVVPSFVYEEIWNRLNEEAGGFFDPYTGVRDDERFNAAVSALKQQLRDEFGPDAIVYPEIWPVNAPVSYGTAQWDGVKRSAPYLTSVAALSLVVVVEDMDGTELFVNGGGLGVTEVWSRTLGVVSMPPEWAFSEEGCLAEAVDVALSPLVKNRPVSEERDESTQRPPPAGLL